MMEPATSPGVYCELPQEPGARRCARRVLAAVTGHPRGFISKLVACRVRCAKAAFRKRPCDEAACVEMAADRLDRLDKSACTSCVRANLELKMEMIEQEVTRRTGDLYCSCQFGFGECRDSGNPCATETCSSAGNCVARSSESCEDNDDNPCTSGVCQDGACVIRPEPAGTPCSDDDGNFCRDEVCDGDGGCERRPLPDGTPCEDHNLCTDPPETCQNGVCTGAAHECSPDNNPCTDDFCLSDLGCTYRLRPGCP